MIPSDKVFGPSRARTPSVEMQARSGSGIPSPSPIACTGSTSQSCVPRSSVWAGQRTGRSRNASRSRQSPADRPAPARPGISVPDSPRQRRASAGTVQPEQRAHQQHAAIPVLDISCKNHRLHQQSLCVYQDMPLLALDLLARVKAMRVNRDPPFSAPFTLWLSMIATLGLACRSAFSRHAT